MRTFSGTFSKMQGKLVDGLAHYTLKIANTEIAMNQYLGKKISIEYEHGIICNNCKKRTKKSYSQGYCYICATTLARCDLCVLNPVNCHYHKGTCREPKWGLDNCFIEHIVYLSFTSNIKIGISRKSNIFQRWIEQGAIKTTVLAIVPSRYDSGKIEDHLSKHLKIKTSTNWRIMLRNEIKPEDLSNFSVQAQKSVAMIKDKFVKNTLQLPKQKIYNIKYPIQKYLDKISSLNIEKDNINNETLLGIKGQYLIFPSGVFNLRKFTSYQVSLCL